jgi:outer membrane protein TolC
VLWLPDESSPSILVSLRQPFAALSQTHGKSDYTALLFTLTIFVKNVHTTLLFLFAICSASALANGGSESRKITLDQAYDMTLRSDESILDAYWKTRSANLEPWSALTRLGPSLTGNAGLTAAGQRTSAPTAVNNEPPGATVQPESTATASVNTHIDTGSMGLTFQQTLLDLTAIPAYRKGKLTAYAARLTYQYTIRQALYGLAQAYYEVLKQQRIVSVYTETVQLAEGQVHVAQSKADAGESLRSDVLSAQVTLESDRQLVIQAQNTLRSDRNKLCNILSIPHDSILDLVEPSAYPTELPGFETLLARALLRREDLKVKSIAIDQNIEARNEVKGEYGPKIVAQLDGNYNRISGSTDSRTASWDAGLSVSMPFLTGGQREIDLRNASYTINEARLDYNSQSKTVEQDVSDAWFQVQTLQASLRSLRVQVASARQNYEDIGNQYRAGTSTSIDVLNALDSLNAARRDLATESYDYQVALRNIEETTGVFQQQRIESLKFK